MIWFYPNNNNFHGKDLFPILYDGHLLQIVVHARKHKSLLINYSNYMEINLFFMTAASKQPDVFCLVPLLH